MEHYKIIEKLSSCRFCTTFLVTEKGDFTNRKLVLKKIECKDENHANRAYHELLQQKLHQDTMQKKVATKSFFIMWDQSICSQKAVQDASIFICVIRNYFQTSLAFVADSFHVIMKPMEEQTIIDYLSKIIELLEPYHNENIAHRSLQLSNIFKYGTENKMHLVDFGISSFLADRKRFSELKDDDLIWLAPELRFPEEEDKADICWLKVDIWCLGSIIMCFFLTSFMDTLNDMKPFMMKTKADECLLNYFWDKLQQMYSEDLLLLAKRLLSRNPEDRPTLRELKECLSEMYCSQKPVLLTKDWPEDYEPIVDENNLSELLNHLSKYSKYNKCAIEILAKLNEHLLSKSDVEFPVADGSIIWELISEHMENPEVVTEGLHVIQKVISMSDEHLQSIFSESTIDIIIKIMESSHNETIFKTIIYNLLMILLTSETATNYLNTKGGMSALLTRSTEDLADDTTVCLAAMTLSNFVVNPPNAEAALQYGIVKILSKNLQVHFKYQAAVEEILAVFIPLSTIESAIIQFNQHKLLTSFVNIMDTYKCNAVIVINCCIILREVLNTISIYDDGMVELIETGAVKVMLSVLYSNTESINMIIECCTTLAILCSMNKDSTYMFLCEKFEDGRKSIYGLQVLMNLYDMYKDSTVDVVAAIFNLLHAFSNYDEACKDLISYEFKRILKYCTTHFHYNQQIVFYGKQVLKKLSEIENILN